MGRFASVKMRNPQGSAWAKRHRETGVMGFRKVFPSHPVEVCGQVMIMGHAFPHVCGGHSLGGPNSAVTSMAAAQTLELMAEQIYAVL